MHELQYEIVAARRQHYDTLLWQVPALGVAAEGFLVSAALSDDAPPLLSAGLWLMASVVGTAVALLFRKLRILEVSDSKLLEDYERKHSDFSVIHGLRIAGFSAYRIWLVLLFAFVSMGGIGTITMAYKALDLATDAGVPASALPRL